MSKLRISLRLIGELPSLEKLLHDLGVEPTELLRKGQRVSKRRTQPIDVWCWDLVSLESDLDLVEIQQALHASAQKINQLAAAIATITQEFPCRADLFISTIREEDQGGLSLPPELVAAAAAAGLSIEVSILVMLDDYEEPELVAAQNKITHEFS